MSAPELHIVPATRGRPSTAAAPVAGFVRDLTPADLHLLSQPRDSAAKPARTWKVLRERHHALARALAQGMKPIEAAAITGMSTQTVYLLQGDPAFRELVAFYLSTEHAALADFQERATTLSLSAMTALQEAVENEDESISPSMALEIFKAVSDRAGHSPVAKSLNVNVNQDLGARMSAANKRLRQG